MTTTATMVKKRTPNYVKRCENAVLVCMCKKCKCVHLIMVSEHGYDALKKGFVAFYHICRQETANE